MDPVLEVILTGTDRIVFRDPNIAFSDLQITYANENVLVEVRGVSILIDDTAVGSISASDFAFFDV